MKARRHLALLVPHICVLWLGRLFTLVVMLLVFMMSAGVWWLQQFHGADKPLDLSNLMPRVEHMAGRDTNLTVGNLKLYYDHGIVVRAENLRLSDADGTLAVLVEQAAVRFSGKSLWRFKIAPRALEANNVTLRLIRNDDHVSIAGLNMGGKDAKPSASLGFVAWLNGLGLNDTWGWLRNVRVGGLTLLLTDNVKHTEWIVQDANVDIGRTSEGGEHGSLVAQVRRVAADGHERQLPVLVTFDHTDGAQTADLRARFGSADFDLISDYLPPQISKMMQAEGTVEVGTSLDRANTLGQPWITLRLSDITFAPPPEFSHPLKFSRLTLTASYQASPTDVLTLRDIDADYKGLDTLHAKGWVQGITTGDPTASLIVYSTGGEAQKIFDFMPDKRLDVAMPFLRKNISADSRVSNVVLSYAGKPSAMPYCGDNCGLVIRGNITKGSAKVVDELPAITNVSGTFTLQGDGLYFNIAPAPMGPQQVSNVHIALTHLFVPGATYLMVSGTVAGPLPPLLTGLQDWMNKPMPVVVGGTHSSGISFTLPFVRGKKTSFDDAVVAVDSNVADTTLQKVPAGSGDLPLPPVKVETANFKIGNGRISLAADGSMAGQDLSANLSDALADFGANLKGTVKWTAPSDATLSMDGNTLSLTGKKLDLSAFDLNTMTTSDSTVKNMNVSVKLDQLQTKDARLDNLNAQLAAHDGRWEINTFTAKVDGTNQVNITTSQSADKRRKMMINVENAGKLLSALGLYQNLRNGRLAGEINYDNPDIGAGVLQMKNFELSNPPVLVRLLGLMSLTQLIAGTDSVLFDKASIPLRFDHDLVLIDNVTMEGPSMSLRLNGNYNRATKKLDITGQLAPAIPFNRLVSKIPLLGTLLTGSQDGVVVADFSLTGSADAPDISVHPLSVITPGLLKDLFNGLTGGNAAPKPQVIDGRSKRK